MLNGVGSDLRLRVLNGVGSSMSIVDLGADGRKFSIFWLLAMVIDRA